MKQQSQIIQSQDSRAYFESEKSQDVFGKYEISSSQPVNTKLVKEFNGSHLALWALGKNLKDRKYYATQIKRGNY